MATSTVTGEGETSGQASQIAIGVTKDDVGGQAMEPQLPYDDGKAAAEMAVERKGDAAMPGDAASPLSVLWIGYLCVFVDFLGVAISIPILPYFTLELPWDSGTVCPSCPQDASTVDFATEGRCGEIDGCGTAFDVGMTNTAFGMGQILGNFIMSKLSDRIGRKPIIIISLLCSTLGYMWCGLAPNLYHLYFARIFSGIAGGTLPVVQAMVLDVTGDPRERPKYFGLAGASLGMAFMIGPAVGAAFAALVDKRAALMSPTFIATLVVLIGFLKIHETRPAGGICGPRSQKARTVHEEGAAQFAATMAKASAETLAAGDKPTVRLPRLVYVCALAMALASFSFSTMTSMCALTWPISYNLGPKELGIFLMGVGCVAIFNNVVVIKRLAARFAPLRVVLVSSLVQCLGVTFFTFIDLLDPGSMTTFIPYIIFFTACISFPWDMQMPNLITIAGNSVAPEIRGMATGIVAAGMSLGMALAPMVAGALFFTDFLSLEHAYGTFSHSVFVLGGVMNLFEFVLLIAFVGCTQKT